jgi:hypothetical protein
MAVTWLTALGALVVGFALPSLHPIFSGAPSRRLLDLLLISIGIMALHKLESFYAREFDHCPVYLSLQRAWWACEPRQAVFVTFCSVFLALMLVVALAMRGAPWLLLLPAIWSAQALHEIHHLGKSLARRGYYSGAISAVLFVAFMDVFFVPEYSSLLALDGRAARLAFYAFQPLLLLAFWVEDRRWLAARAQLGQVAPAA